MDKTLYPVPFANIISSNQLIGTYVVYIKSKMKGRPTILYIYIYIQMLRSLIEGQLIYNIITIHRILWHRIILNDPSWGPQHRINVYYEIWNWFYLLKFYNAFSPNIFVFIWVHTIIILVIDFILTVLECL